MEYAIPHKRQLNEIENELLYFLFQKKKPEWVSLIERLRVIGRCGCGKCPTVLFGISFDQEAKINQRLIIDYWGYGKNGDPIGVLLFGDNEMPTELEFYSLDGQSEVFEYPLIETLKPTDS